MCVGIVRFCSVCHRRSTESTHHSGISSGQGEGNGKRGPRAAECAPCHRGATPPRGGGCGVRNGSLCDGPALPRCSAAQSATPPPSPVHELWDRVPARVPRNRTLPFACSPPDPPQRCSLLRTPIPWPRLVSCPSSCRKSRDPEAEVVMRIACFT